MMQMIITAMQRVFFCFMKTADSTMPIIDNSRSIVAAVTVIIAPFCGRRTYYVSRVYIFSVFSGGAFQSRMSAQPSP